VANVYSGYAISYPAGGTSSAPIAVTQPSGGYFTIWGTKGMSDTNVDANIKVDNAGYADSKLVAAPVSGMGNTEWSYQVWGLSAGTHRIDITVGGTVVATTYVSV
jgi:hypothetical protein